MLRNNYMHTASIKAFSSGAMYAVSPDIIKNYLTEYNK